MRHQIAADIAQQCGWVAAQVALLRREVHPPVVIVAVVFDVAKLGDCLLGSILVARQLLNNRLLLDAALHLLRQMRVQAQTRHVILAVNLHRLSVRQTLHGFVHAFLKILRVDHNVSPDELEWHTLLLRFIVILVIIARTILDVMAWLVTASANVALWKMAGVSTPRTVAAATKVSSTSVVPIVSMVRPIMSSASVHLY